MKNHTFLPLLALCYATIPLASLAYREIRLFMLTAAGICTLLFLLILFMAKNVIEMRLLHNHALIASCFSAFYAYELFNNRICPDYELFFSVLLGCITMAVVFIVISYALKYFKSELTRNTNEEISTLHKALTVAANYLPICLCLSPDSAMMFGFVPILCPVICLNFLISKRAMNLILYCLNSIASTFILTIICMSEGPLLDETIGEYLLEIFRQSVINLIPVAVIIYLAILIKIFSGIPPKEEAEE